MRLIMEQWRTFLNESLDPRIQKQLDALPEDVAIVVGSGGTGLSKIFSYVRLEDPETQQYSVLTNDDSTTYKDRKITKTGYPHGSITIMSVDDEFEGPCLGSYVVVGAEAERGWGPLLYEVALEWSTKNGNGLMPDRSLVSDYAEAVWKKYTDRSDIDKQQLDTNPKHPRSINKAVKQLTPDIKQDDCDQTKSIQKYGEEWADSSLSKVYKKNSTELLDALSSSKRLIII